MTGAPAFTLVAVDRVVVGENVRLDVGDVSELAESIRRQGVLQPLICCPGRGDTLELLIGQRRFAAAQKVGLKVVPVLMRPRPQSEIERVLMQVAENFEREDMTPIEEAMAIRTLTRGRMSQAAIAVAVNRTQGWVSHRLMLLAMPDCLREALNARWITPSAAIEIPVGLREDPEAMERCARVLRRGNRALRAWLRTESTETLRRPRGRGGDRSVYRSINVPVAAQELARARAKESGVPIGEWAAAAIYAYDEAQNGPSDSA